ncbi:N-acetylmuramoyl-L-alanine amidase [Tissierella sp. Yu-01]|uniref:N-acetylmuramoyl-L-alanine amidase family protein n=1 Tax=Tissierella sp. Yu-01 TaxID=3035694 RepID=UPI00240DD006|nr:N-acetylmuramoyl-L-alanine amidase [Tissierella sp. Yu-01]WFA09292.1 N-acetylmuramoyl-L-alanine amidase [Tissierella sp. Yu-01]
MDKRFKLVAIIILLILIVLLWNKNKQESNEELGTTEDIFKVVIDPGHGGKDVGTIGTSGLYEKDFTLSLAKKVNEILGKEDRVQIYMTREDDTFISTKDKYRPKFANDLDADLYISIHGNAYESSNVFGTETYYYNEESKYLAEIIHKNVVKSTGFKDRGVRKEDLFVVRKTDMPSVLLEVGYLTNPQEEQQMFDDELQYSTAESICEGIKEYLGIE